MGVNAPVASLWQDPAPNAQIEAAIRLTPEIELDEDRSLG
jgi:hypothetical protein